VFLQQLDNAGTYKFQNNASGENIIKKSKEQRRFAPPTRGTGAQKTVPNQLTEFNIELRNDKSG
jgi:hypothetical protein